jgi:hypothetical protein
MTSGLFFVNYNLYYAVLKYFEQLMNSREIVRIYVKTYLRDNC